MNRVKPVEQWIACIILYQICMVLHTYMYRCTYYLIIYRGPCTSLITSYIHPVFTSKPILSSQQSNTGVSCFLEALQNTLLTCCSQTSHARRFRVSGGMRVGERSRSPSSTLFFRPIHSKGHRAVDPPVIWGKVVGALKKNTTLKSLRYFSSRSRYLCL